jgi:glutamine amidotransferase
MLKPQIAVLDYGLGNVKSICNALDRTGSNPLLTNNKESIQNAQGLIIPGVGAFSTAMDALKRNKLVDHIIYYADTLKKPTLGICLGMQLLFDISYEFGKHQGLHLISGSVDKFNLALNTEKKLPHISWAELKFNHNDVLFKDIPQRCDVYFVHSYICNPILKEAVIATANFGNTLFCAAARKNNIVGVQFHPEKSGEIGLRLLRNFVEQCGN